MYVHTHTHTHTHTHKERERQRQKKTPGLEPEAKPFQDSSVFSLKAFNWLDKAQEYHEE